jgi:hypothetical protein
MIVSQYVKYLGIYFALGHIFDLLIPNEELVGAMDRQEES